MSNLETKLEELLEFKITKSSEEKKLKSQQKKLDKKLKNVREIEAKLKLAKAGTEANQTKVDENKNEPQSDDDTIVTPSVPVDNGFDIFYEVEHKIISDDTTIEDNIEEDKMEEDITVKVSTKEDLNKVEAKMKISTHEKIVWKCELCDQAYPRGYTMDPALHKREYLKQT